jgi:hypothetical protein
MTDQDFLHAVARGAEPTGHESNLRLAWCMLRVHGRAGGLRATESAIAARAGRAGGRWDPVLTAAWFHRVADAEGRRPSGSFTDFLAAHPELTGARREPAHA